MLDAHLQARHRRVVSHLRLEPDMKPRATVSRMGGLGVGRKKKEDRTRYNFLWYRTGCVVLFEVATTTAFVQDNSLSIGELQYEVSCLSYF